MIGDAGLAEYNNLYDTGHLQSDGAMIQFMEDQQDGAICRYNWLHDTEKYGARLIIVETQMEQMALCITI